jgi:hypothetical protein
VSLVAGGELGEVSVVVTHPVSRISSAQGTFDVNQEMSGTTHILW